LIFIIFLLFNISTRHFAISTTSVRRGQRNSQMLRYHTESQSKSTFSFNGITPGIAQAGKPMPPFDCTLVLVDRLTDSLTMISKSLEDIRQEHQEGMAADLSEVLMAMAAIVQTLSDNMHQCWHLKAEKPPSGHRAQSQRFH
jgi:hypothetical protein